MAITYDDCNAIEENIVLARGADYEEVEWYTDENDNPEDISGDTIRAEVREYAGGPLIAEFTLNIFLDNTEPTPFYKYQRLMDQDIINALSADLTEARWDQFREYADGFVEKDFYGTVTIPSNITNPTK